MAYLLSRSICLRTINRRLNQRQAVRRYCQNSQVLFFRVALSLLDISVCISI